MQEAAMPNKPKAKAKKRVKSGSQAVRDRFKNFDGKRYSPKKGAGRKKNPDLSGS
jgi:hypothetical protein